METVKPIKTEEEYNLALQQMASVFHAKKNTPEGDVLEVLALLIGDYEAKHYPIRKLSAIEALKS